MNTNNLLLRNGLLIDGTGKKEIENMSISILNGKIVSIFRMILILQNVNMIGLLN